MRGDKPTYALATLSADSDAQTLDMAGEVDILQRMRTLVAFEIFELPELRAMADQVLRNDGYRFFYWTTHLDHVQNPAVAPGRYTKADCGEPIGPGHTSLSALSFANSCEWHSVALVWSQSFSLSNRTDAGTDADRIRERSKKLKCHYNSLAEMASLQGYLDRNDVKGCIRTGAAAVEASLKFYCAEWEISFTNQKIPFDEKIEHILHMAGRPSYRRINSSGLRDLLHLYRSRNASHEGDCYYKDDGQKKDVYCDMSHARTFAAAAQAFTFWLDSQA